MGGNRVRRFDRLAVAAIVCAAAAVVAGPITAPGVASAAGGASSAYVPVGPCRLTDTRPSQGSFGFTRLDPNTISIAVAGRCGVPSATTAVALALTVSLPIDAGYLTAWPSGSPRPEASNVNFRDGEDRANGSITTLGPGGSIDVFVSVGAEVIVDVTGAFVATPASAAGRLVPITPTRVLDTRGGAMVPAGSEVIASLPAGVPADATAMAVTITTTGPNAPGFLTAFPDGTARPYASVLNTDAAGQTRAAGQIVPVSSGGLRVFASAATHVIVDVTGWFTGPSAPVATDGLFVAADVPFRITDTRRTNPLYPGGTIDVASPIAGAGALAVNVTLDLAERWGFVTAYPARTARPTTSTVNATDRGETSAAFAIVPQSSEGIGYYSHAGNELIVDVAGWFPGAVVAPTQTFAANLPSPRCASGSSAASLTSFFNDGTAPLSGGDYQRATRLPDGRILWTFQDALVPNRFGQRVMVHNAGMIQTGNCYQLLRGGTFNDPASWLMADRTTPYRRWFWPLGTTSGHDGYYRVFLAEMRENGSSYLSRSEPVATWIATIRPSDMAVISTQPAPNASASLYGFAITSDASWTYLYAHCHRQFGWDLLPFSDPPTYIHDLDCAADVRVARVPRGQPEATPSYWNGSSWVTNPAAAAPVMPRSPDRQINPSQVEFDGRQFVAVTKEGDWWGDTIYVDVAPAAQGPWTTVAAVPTLPRCVGCNNYFASIVPWRTSRGALIVGLSNNTWSGPYTGWYNPTFFVV
jgi:hypothetical protein